VFAHKARPHQGDSKEAPARIWLPKGQTNDGQALTCPRGQNPDVYTKVWPIQKVVKEIRSTLPAAGK